MEPPLTSELDLSRSLLLLLVLGACTVSPQPDPPAFDVDRVGYGAAELVGEPDAVEPGGAEVWISPLFDAVPPTVLIAADDGSFGPLPWTATETRVQVRDGDRRGDPVDIVRDGDRATLRPATACVVVPPQVDLGEVPLSTDTVRSLEIRNDCAFDAEIVPGLTDFLGTGPGFDLDDIGLGLDLLAGETATLDILVFSDTPGELRDRLRVDLSGDGIDEQRAIEVFATAR